MELKKTIFSNEQNDAVEVIKSAVKRKQLEIALTGPAGSGKTTVIGALVECFGDDCVVVTPTNAAAKVLCEKGIEADTFHKVFMVPAVVTKPDGKKFVGFELYRDWKLKRGAHVAGKLEFSPVIIVDEASMVSGFQLHQLRQVCDSLILVGDANQLPPVGDKKNPVGYFNSIKYDCSLKKVHRHENGLLDLATQLREKKVDPLGSNLLLGMEAWQQWNHMAGFKDIMRHMDSKGESWRFIVWRNSTKAAVNYAIRLLRGHTTPFPVAGEVLQNNSHSMSGFINGEMMTVVSCNIPPIETFEEAAQYLNTMEPHAAQKYLEDTFSGIEAAEILYPTLKFTTDDGKVHSCRFDLLKWVKANAPQATTVRFFLEMLTTSFRNTTSEKMRNVAMNVLADSYQEKMIHPFFAYATTCHKAQGNEFDHVFIVDERVVLGLVTNKEMKRSLDNGDEFVPLTGDEAARRWFYTAITRAKQSASVIYLDQVKPDSPEYFFKRRQA